MGHRGQLVEVDSLYHHLSPRDQNQIVRLGGRWLYLPNYLTHPGGTNLLSLSCIRWCVTEMGWQVAPGQNQQMLQSDFSQSLPVGDP